MKPDLFFSFDDGKQSDAYRDNEQAIPQGYGFGFKNRLQRRQLGDGQLRHGDDANHGPYNTCSTNGFPG